MVVVVACGERAGEVVETINDFPKMSDPKSGGSLMDRTIIILQHLLHARDGARGLDLPPA